MLLSHLRRRLAWKIFLSFLAVIVVGIIVLAATVEYSVPSTFERHMLSMGSMMGDSMMGDSMMLESDLFTNFRSAVNESLTLAALAASLTAVVISVFISQRVVAPVREMMFASQRIAAGHYDERVRVVGDLEKDELDELAQLALSFNRMAANLEKTEVMRSQLIGDVTHELRTPLTAIKGSVEGLIDGVLPQEAETYQQIAREVDRLKSLVNDLQELSRVEAGAYELDRKPIHPAELVKTAVERLERQFSEKGVSLSHNVPDDLPLVSVDEKRIGQVLLNLLGNALQYTPAGGEVEISVKALEEEIRFAIRDTGVGIGIEHLPHVFTRFYRVDKSRSRAGGGSGIGLTIAKHLLEAHGGRIWAESDGPGLGSTFSFTLPTTG